MKKNIIKPKLKKDGVEIISSALNNLDFIDLKKTILSCFIKYGGKKFDKFHYSNFLDNINFHKQAILFRKNNKKNFGLIYDVIQNSLSLYNFFTNNKIASVLRKKVDLSIENSIIYPVMIRIDIPFDKRNSLDWHQDNLIEEINISYKEGKTVWIPLSDVNNNNGSIQLCLGSHFFRYQKNIEKRNKKDNQSSINSKTPSIITDKFDKILINAKKGDVVVFSMNTLHKSSLNSSNKIRFTAVARFYDIRTKCYIPGRTKYQSSSKLY